MNRYFIFLKLCICVMACSWAGGAYAESRDEALEKLRNELDAMRDQYEKRIDELEKKIDRQSKIPVNEQDLSYSSSNENPSARISGNQSNPAVSLTLNARYTELDSSELELAGFQLGGEAGLPDHGFSTGHNELSISGNIDDKFYGKMTSSLVYEDGETELELEEAFIETLGFGAGFTIKGGRFLSDVGYLNSIHEHAHDFADRPLVYDGMLGGHLVGTGLQLSWVAPMDFYLNLGAEVTAGSEFPAGDNDTGDNGLAFFAKTGGDIGASSSWQLGLSHYSAEFDVREAGGHSHGGDSEADNELMNGDIDIAGVDFVYKWAPGGNTKDRNLTLQAEYFWRDESGHAEFEEEDGANTYAGEGDYDGKQQGYYVQAVYQFMPAWRVGLRYDHLEADNDITNYTDNSTGVTLDVDEFGEETGLGVGDDPDRATFMIDYSPSHFSRIRLQYSDMDNGHEDNQEMIMLQYIMSLGAHGAHTY